MDRQYTFLMSAIVFIVIIVAIAALVFMARPRVSPATGVIGIAQNTAGMAGGGMVKICYYAGYFSFGVPTPLTQDCSKRVTFYNGEGLIAGYSYLTTVRVTEGK